MDNIEIFEEERLENHESKVENRFSNFSPFLAMGRSLDRSSNNINSIVKKEDFCFLQMKMKKKKIL